MGFQSIAAQEEEDLGHLHVQMRSELEHIVTLKRTPGQCVRPSKSHTRARAHARACPINDKDHVSSACARPERAVAVTHARVRERVLAR